jgi:hypothetical protein
LTAAKKVPADIVILQGHAAICTGANFVGVDESGCRPYHTLIDGKGVQAAVSEQTLSLSTAIRRVASIHRRDRPKHV